MKNTYVKPMMQVEEFLANQYVAACGDSGTWYYFDCNMPRKTGLYEESNGIAGFQNPNEKILDCNKSHTHKNSCYKPKYNNPDKTVWTTTRYGCGEKHVASSLGDFKNGYTGDGTKVIIWYEKPASEGLDYVHVTTDISKENWETTKS